MVKSTLGPPSSLGSTSATEALLCGVLHVILQQTFFVFHTHLGRLFLADTRQLFGGLEPQRSMLFGNKLKRFLASKLQIWLNPPRRQG